jgi:hypothetical protein
VTGDRDVRPAPVRPRARERDLPTSWARRYRPRFLRVGRCVSSSGSGSAASLFQPGENTQGEQTAGVAFGRRELRHCRRDDDSWRYSTTASTTCRPLRVSRMKTARVSRIRHSFDRPCSVDDRPSSSSRRRSPPGAEQVGGALA